MAYESKSRILYVKKILEERTDVDHYLSTNQLINILKNEYDIPAHRTTIKSDVDLLIEAGYDIVALRSTQTRFYFRTRTFELPELKLLVDAVESSKFITEKKSKELIKKLYGTVNKYQRATIKRHNFVPNRLKPKNENIYDIIDIINKAINEKKQIAFQYYDYKVPKRKVLRNRGEMYLVSPYNLVWNNDFYYLVAYSEKRECLVNFRVDRISDKIEMMNIKAKKKPSGYNIAEYTQRNFSMFNGEVEKIDLICNNELLKTMIDHFGTSMKAVAVDKAHFKTSVNVAVTPKFFGWVFGFDGKIKIVGPDDVCDKYKQMVLKVIE